jgi:hypothetical protein
MPRFYFHLFDDVTAIDEEGLELPNEAAAMERAADITREMAAESVRTGHLILDHCIDIANENGDTIGTVHFRDVVQIRQSEAST